MNSIPERFPLFRMGESNQSAGGLVLQLLSQNGTFLNMVCTILKKCERRNYHDPTFVQSAVAE